MLLLRKTAQQQSLHMQAFDKQIKKNELVFKQSLHLSVYTDVLGGGGVITVEHVFPIILDKLREQEKDGQE